MDGNRKRKETEIKRLKKLIGQIPEKAVEARKVYSAIDLMDRIRTVCFADPMCTSSDVQVDNLVSVGKRIAYIRHEFDETDFNAMMRYAVSFLLNGLGQDEKWRGTAIKSIESAFEEHERYSRSFKESSKTRKGRRALEVGY